MVVILDNIGMPILLGIELQLLLLFNPETQR